MTHIKGLRADDVLIGPGCREGSLALSLLGTRRVFNSRLAGVMIVAMTTLLELIRWTAPRFEHAYPIGERT